MSPLKGITRMVYLSVTIDSHKRTKVFFFCSIKVLYNRSGRSFPSIIMDYSKLVCLKIGFQNVLGGQDKVGKKINNSLRFSFSKVIFVRLDVNFCSIFLRLFQWQKKNSCLIYMKYMIYSRRTLGN